MDFNKNFRKPSRGSEKQFSDEITTAETVFVPYLAPLHVSLLISFVEFSFSVVKSQNYPMSNRKLIILS